MMLMIKPTLELKHDQKKKGKLGLCKSFSKEELQVSLYSLDQQDTSVC